MSTTTYPSSPKNIPARLTQLPFSYSLRVILAILSIVLFFVLYAAMVIGLSYLVYYAVFYEMISINKLTILLKIGAIAGSVMLLVFTLKFIFKLKNHQPNNRIKLLKEEHPEIWKFVLNVCNETNAPKPKSIYIDPDVNAYVAYSNSWLSLIMPVRKDLTIGLGLVSCLNVSEFKAVISHEFGHFAQKSMRIGSYIMSANTIIYDMIFSRDKWDDLLDQWRGADVRLSAAAWVITPIIWLIRQALNLFYQLLNIMYSSLSREMEFNADKVAIKTSGSDAILSGLWKLDKGFENWNNTINHAYLAAQKNWFVKNLYTHNNLEIERGEEQQKSELSKLPNDKRGGKQYFSVSENSKVAMYASHPPNDLRQENAKSPYVECDIHEASAWDLFSKREKIQEEMTSLVYKTYMNKKHENIIEVAKFEAFIKEESQDKRLLEEYGDAFKDRFLNIPSIEKLGSIKGEKTDQEAFQHTLKEELKELMKPVKEIEQLMTTAQQIAEGTVRQKSFKYQGVEYKKKDLNRGYERLMSERDTLLNKSFDEWDEKFCSFYLNLADQQQLKSNLIQLYSQHRAIVKFYKTVLEVKNNIYKGLHEVQSKEELTDYQLNNFGDRVNTTYSSLNESLAEFDQLNFVPLPNIENVEDLKTAIIEGKEFKKETGPLFENGGFDRILNQIEQVIVHCQRIDQKSIGGILKFHKTIA